MSWFGTTFGVFLSDLVFSTTTKPFPGEMMAAFQNSVPKSMPMTWLLTTAIIAAVSSALNIQSNY